VITACIDDSDFQAGTPSIHVVDHPVVTILQWNGEAFEKFDAARDRSVYSNQIVLSAIAPSVARVSKNCDIARLDIIHKCRDCLIHLTARNVSSQHHVVKTLSLQSGGVGARVGYCLLKFRQVFILVVADHQGDPALRLSGCDKSCKEDKGGQRT